jgi:succinoglycan biosynthesis protein ExoA
MQPSISVIIPVRPSSSARDVLQSLMDVDYPKDKIEVLLVEGTQPSKQRNEAARQAQGEILYFLDDDSVVHPLLFTVVAGAFGDEGVVAVGGPAVTRETDSFLQKCFGHALGAHLGSLWMRRKFKATGRVKLATEQDLILANLAINRHTFLKSGGFNESLYPNEENELLNRLEIEGCCFIYDAKALVYRSQRRTLGSFVRQLFNYGRGRMEHFLVSPRFFRPIFLVPLVFTSYLISLPLIHHSWYWAPLALYILLGLIQTGVLAFEQRQPKVFLIVPFLFPVMHVSYGGGLAWAMIRWMLCRSTVSSGGSVTCVTKVSPLCEDHPS